MINVENLTKSYGDYILFKDVSFRINKGEKIGLLGRNGHGKTTMFRIIAGLIKPDSGNLIIPKNYRIGYVRQIISFTKETVLEEGMNGLSEAEKDHSWKVEKLLSGLGFSYSDMQRDPREFSGGFQVRLNLAKALASDPDLILLDEPTNYLDITSIRWLISFLNGWPHELLLITHDRGFMDKVSTHILGIHRKKIRKISGDTAKYYSQIALDEEIYEKTRLNDEKRKKEVEIFISRFRAKARLANLVQSRIKTISKMEKREKLEKPETLEFSFRYSSFPSKNVMRARDIHFSYNPGNPIIKGLDINIQAGEKVCVIGKNGRGKTTLLRLIAGSLKPDKGTISYNPNVKKGIFEQTNITSLVPDRTVEEEIFYSDSDADRQDARNISGAMMFSGDNALKKISVLSGGEKSRVMLGKILAKRVNLLILDEPANHLDMEASDVLLAALDSFKGAVIMVTHNEMFLHAIAERLIVFNNNRQYIFEGSYSDFLEKIGWDQDSEEKQKNTPVKHGKQRLRQKRSEIVKKRAAALNPLKKEIKQTESKIEALENRVEKLNKDMIQASQEGDSKQIVFLSKKTHSKLSEIDRLYENLESLSVEFEEKKELFEKELELCL